MLAQLDNIEKCLVAGQDCSEEGMEEYNCQKEGKEDKVCLWRNALTVARIYDKIMRYTLFLNAMNAQYDAIKNINGNAQILEYDATENASKEKKSSSAEIYLNSETNVASYHEITTVKSYRLCHGSPAERAEFRRISVRLISASRANNCRSILRSKRL